MVQTQVIGYAGVIGLVLIMFCLIGIGYQIRKVVEEVQSVKEEKQQLPQTERKAVGSYIIGTSEKPAVRWTQGRQL